MRQPGSIWTLSAGDFKEMTFGLLLASGDATARVVPLVWETSGLPSDIALPIELLGFELWARCGEAFPILTEQLVEPLGEVASADRNRIAATAAALSERFETSSSQDVGIRPEGSRDARRDALEAWRDDNARWLEPYRLLEGPNLATVVHRRRERLELTIEGLADVADIPKGVVTRLEGGKLDLFAELPVPGLVHLTGVLSLPPSRRLQQLVKAAVAAGPVEPSYGQEPAMARRRRGVRSSWGSVPRGDEAAATYSERLKELLPKWPS